MTSSITQRVLKGIGSNVFNKGITIAIQLLSVPLFLTKWGTNLYGEWLILYSIPAYVAMAESGFSGIAGTEMTIHAAKNNRDKCLEIFQASKILITTIGACVLLVLSILAYYVPFQNWLNFSSLTNNQAKSVAILLAAYAIVTFIHSNTQAAFRSLGLYAFGNTLGSIILFSTQGLTLLAVYFGATPIGAALTLLSSQTVFALILRWNLKQKAPWLFKPYTRSSRDNIKPLIKPGLAYIAFPLTNALSLQGVLAVISVILGTQAVVVFNTLRTLTRLGVQAANTISLSILPEISTALGENNLSKLKRLHTANFHLVLLIIGAVSTLLWFLGEEIYLHWTRNTVNFDRSLWALLIIGLILNQIWQCSLILLLGTNKHIYFAKISTLNAFLLIAISAPLSIHFGLKGMGYGLILFELISMYFVTKITLPILKETRKEFWARLATPQPFGWFKS